MQRNIERRVGGPPVSTRRVGPGPQTSNVRVGGRATCPKCGSTQPVGAMCDCELEEYLKEQDEKNG